MECFDTISLSSCCSNHLWLYTWLIWINIKKLWLSSFWHSFLFLTPLAKYQTYPVEMFTRRYIQSNLPIMNWPSPVVSMRQQFVWLFEHRGCMQLAVNVSQRLPSHKVCLLVHRYFAVCLLGLFAVWNHRLIHIAKTHCLVPLICVPGN